MTEKPTPGPWLVSRFNDRRVISDEAKAQIAQCERAANARLIAQAPIMADLCRHLAAGETPDSAFIMETAEQVVAKIDDGQ
ncbi:MAG: hypothetical protein ACYYKD_09480 [Rhodospirillales bacterium]